MEYEKRNLWKFAYQNLLKFKPWKSIDDIMFKIEKIEDYIKDWIIFFENNQSKDPHFLKYKNALLMEEEYNQDLENMSINSEDFNREFDGDYQNIHDHSIELTKLCKFDYDYLYQKYIDENNDRSLQDIVKFENDQEWKRFNKTLVDNSAINYIGKMRNIYNAKEPKKVYLDINTLNQK